MADVGAVRTKTQLIAAAGDAGDFADNTTKAILAKHMRNFVETVYGKMPLRTETDTYTVAYDDGVILCNKATAMTVDLPDATTARMSGRIFIIKNINVGIVTIDGSGSQTIDGETTVTLDQKYQALAIQCDGSNWVVIGGAN